jgi:hypothetical protein
MELFGYESGVYLALACLIAYYFSGRGSIYASQNLEEKYLWQFKNGGWFSSIGRKK